jgi:hypothetical protein
LTLAIITFSLQHLVAKNATVVAIRELTLMHADASMLFSRAASGAIEQTPRIL